MLLMLFELIIVRKLGQILNQSIPRLHAQMRDTRHVLRSEGLVGLKTAPPVVRVLLNHRRRRDRNRSPTLFHHNTMSRGHKLWQNFMKYSGDGIQATRDSHTLASKETQVI
jgi:hypothetical protein